MQIIADVTGCNFSVVKNPRNAGALGSAIIALIGLGELKSFADAKNFVQIEAKYKPDPANKAIYDKLFSDYKTLYAALRKPYIKANSRRFEGLEK